MKKNPKIVSINEQENWGGLVHPGIHTAAFGVRFADNRSREFGIFGNRMTLIGEERVAQRLEKLVLSNKMIREIKNNTSFSYYGDKDMNFWSTSRKIGEDIFVSIDVTCSGEYVYVRSYADRIESERIGVVPVTDNLGDVAWMVTIGGRCRNFPIIHTETKADATNILMDYIANELDGRDDIWPA